MDAMTEILIHAPFSGWLAPLSETPDAAFAQGMVGPGAALDPTDGMVRAPFDGLIVTLPASRHAVSLRSDEGVELLIHFGLDTVGLNGRGFTAHVAQGDRVRVGDLLLTVDLDQAAEGARDLISPLIVTDGADRVRVIEPHRKVKHGDPILAVTRGARSIAADTAEVSSRLVRAVLPHGLHARPSARIAAAVKPFDARVEIILDDRAASASSLSALMQLGVKDGDTLRLSGSGPQAQAAVEALSHLIEAGLEDPQPERSAAHASPISPIPPISPAVASGYVKTVEGEWILSGVRAAPGLALGRTVRLQNTEVSVPHEGRSPEIERQALHQALSDVREKLEAAGGKGSIQQRTIVQAHIGFLDDPALLEGALDRIGQGRSAAYAWRESTRAIAELFRGLADPRMVERADDLADLETQVVAVLTGAAQQTPTNLGPDVILIADDLLPSQLIGLEAGQIAGICTARGGPTSHVALLAAALGLPALVAIGPDPEQMPEDVLAILDADNQRLILHPTAARLAATQSRQTAAARRLKEAHASAQEPCITADGVRIEIFANLGHVAEAAPAVAGGAEGCGLLRTEFLFLERDTAPTEDEQLACYQAIADALDGRPFILRTLDAGGDKPMAYMPMPHEENPALGLRGVRSGLARPDLLLTQLKAACRVQSKGPVGVMLPMIASHAEILQVRAILDRAVDETEAKRPLIGIMIETPAAAATVDLLRPSIDFISIGSNDLTQYALAMDRQNAAVASQLDGLHPAVLRLIAQAVEKAEGLTWVGVCGGLASDPVAAALLIGLGVRELSVAPAVAAGIKAGLRRLNLSDCASTAREALTLDSAEAIRGLVAARLMN